MAQSGEAMIEIKLRTMDSQTHKMCISNQRRVQNLKEDIACLVGMPVEQQRLIYCGKVLKDEQVISSCNVQHGDTLHLVCKNVPSMSSNDSSSSHSGASNSQGIPAGSDGISVDTRQGVINAIETLSRYLNRVRQENRGTENNMNEVFGSIFNPSAPSQGISDVVQLARLLSFIRDILNQTSQLFLDLEEDLLQNLNVEDPRVRHGTMRTVQIMFEYVYTYFLGLQHNLDLVGLHHQNNSDQTRSSFSVEDLIESFQNMSSQHQHEQAIANIGQQNDTELTDVYGEENNINSSSIPDGDIHVEETSTPRETTENDTENMRIGVSSGPSTVEYRHAHESSIEVVVNSGTCTSSSDLS